MSTFDTKTKVLFTLVFMGIVISTYFLYQKIIIERDFEIFDSEEEYVEDVESVQDEININMESGSSTLPNENIEASSTLENN